MKTTELARIFSVWNLQQHIAIRWGKGRVGSINETYISFIGISLIAEKQRKLENR